MNHYGTDLKNILTVLLSSFKWIYLSQVALTLKKLKVIFDLLLFKFRKLIRSLINLLRIPNIAHKCLCAVKIVKECLRANIWKLERGH
jgi:hypothetical protein